MKSSQKVVSFFAYSLNRQSLLLSVRLFQGVHKSQNLASSHHYITCLFHAHSPIVVVWNFPETMRCVMLMSFWWLIECMYIFAWTKLKDLINKIHVDYLEFFDFLFFYFFLLLVVLIVLSDSLINFKIYKHEFQM